MMKREELESALRDAESHLEAAKAERDRLLRHYGAELGLRSERATKDAWEEAKAALAGTGPAPDAGKVAACVDMIGKLGSEDAIEAHLGAMLPAVRESAEVKAAVAARLEALAAAEVAIVVEAIGKQATREDVQAVAESLPDAVRRHPDTQRALTSRLNAFAVKV